MAPQFLIKQGCMCTHVGVFVKSVLSGDSTHKGESTDHSPNNLWLHQTHHSCPEKQHFTRNITGAFLLTLKIQQMTGYVTRKLNVGGSLQSETQRAALKRCGWSTVHTDANEMLVES